MSNTLRFKEEDFPKVKRMMDQAGVYGTYFFQNGSVDVTYTPESLAQFARFKRGAQEDAKRQTLH